MTYFQGYKISQLIDNILGVKYFMDKFSITEVMRIVATTEQRASRIIFLSFCIYVSAKSLKIFIAENKSP